MKKVLVVDDTKNIRLLLSKSLELQGYDVDTACNGKEALELLSSTSYDLAFLDIKLPEIRGTEVLRRIRDKGITTPVIIITAYATVKNAVDCTKMGAVAYVQKPFTGDKIKGVIEELSISALPNKKEPIELNKNFMEQAKYPIRTGNIEQAKYHMNIGNIELAIEILTSELSSNVENAEIYHLLGDAYNMLGQADRAQKYYNIHKIFSNDEQ